MSTQAVAILDRSPSTAVRASGVPDGLRRAVMALREWFGAEFSVLDPASDQWLWEGADQPPSSSASLVEMCRAVAEQSRPQLMAEEAPLVVLAIPLAAAGGGGCVAVATFLTQSPGRELAKAAESLGLHVPDIAAWAERQAVWPCERLLRTAELVAAKWSADERAADLRQEVHDLSVHLAATYEEISLLHRLTQNLKISGRVDQLVQMTLEWLAEVIPAQGLVAQLLPPPEESAADGRASRRPILLTHGHCPLDGQQFERLIEHLGAAGSNRPLVVNPPLTSAATWPLPEIQQLVVVPLSEGEHLFGWLACMNHRLRAEFGSVEASLLSSVGAILGIHGGNLELYRQQAEFLSGVVRALTSAIDAKDPYTCGHSDRVARIATRLAVELGCSQEQFRAIYLSGLLHDIGKIGVNDSVLRKPGKLTEAEFEHVKAHTEIGYRILKGLKQLDEVLPVVRHHHESWDGRGYPCGLTAFEIPFMARIVAVADAFDAMSSDRPYRRGMPDNELDAILRSGAGKQWDSEVIEAFFRARDDIREIARRDPQAATPDVWQLS